MKTLAERLYDLKQAIGGNHEKSGYEHSFGRTVHEKAGIRPAPVYITRILSELRFVMKLTERTEKNFEAEADAALTLLEKALAEDGTLTRSVCAEAEKLLMPAAEACREYDLIYVGHAHIDMNWMWGMQETVAATLATFRTVLFLMEEYPEFTFIQSQASVYKIVEQYDPALMPAIQKRIAEGRWEVTANGWTEPDKNMPDTESLLHHVSVSREYLRDVWNIDPDTIKVDFVPDTFGHSRFVPEIDAFHGIRYYYHCRGYETDKTLYRYRAPSGKELLMYKEPCWYNSSPIADNAVNVIDISLKAAGLKTGLVVYGVGDHGGGPTRRDVEKIIEMQKWPVFPKIRFGTLGEFFEIAESVYDKLDVVEHELNSFATGCYTTQSRIKMGNRKGELMLNDAAKLCALTKDAAGTEYPRDRFTKAWQNILFNHFHDIIPGSCVQESREYSMGLYAEALGYTQTALNNAFRCVAENTDTSAYITEEDIAYSMSEGAGAGYHAMCYGQIPNPERGVGLTRVYTVFNTASSARKDTVTVTLWDYPGDLNNLEAVDAAGNMLTHQLLESEPQWFWDHGFIRLLVEVSLPALGYTTFILRQKKRISYPSYCLGDDRTEHVRGPFVLENDYIKAVFDCGSGMLLSLTDKQTGREQLSAPAGLTVMMTEKYSSDAWNIGRYIKALPVDGTTRVTSFGGALRSGIEITQKVLDSFITTTVSLDRNAKALSYAFKVDWHESATRSDNHPVLTFTVPVKGGAKEVLCDVPAGFVTRGEKYQDVCALSFAQALGAEAKPVIYTDCKYGYRLYEDTLVSTLINTAGYPDPYPENGIHEIRLWLGTDAGTATEIKRVSEALLREPVAIATGKKPGKLPLEMSLMTLNAAHTVLSGVEINAQGETEVHLYEADGAPESGTIVLPGKTVAFEIGAYELKKVIL